MTKSKEPELNLLIIDPYFNTVPVRIPKKIVDEFYKAFDINVGKAKRNKGKRELYATINEFIEEVKERKGED